MKKAVQQTEAPVICFIQISSICVAVCRRTLVTCTIEQEDVSAVLSIYYVCYTMSVSSSTT